MDISTETPLEGKCEEESRVLSQILGFEGKRGETSRAVEKGREKSKENLRGEEPGKGRVV